MKKKYVAYLSILLVICMIISGCNKAETPPGTETDQVAGTSEVLQTSSPEETTDSGATPEPGETETGGAITDSADIGETPSNTPSGSASQSTTGRTPATKTPTATRRPSTPTKTPPTTTKTPVTTKPPTTVPPTRTVNASLAAANKKNNYVGYTQVTNRQTGISWPTGQSLPTFATPNTTLDTISVTSLTDDERITFSSLQGLVNANKPSILLLDNNPDEGATTWSTTFGFKRTTVSRTNRYTLMTKYASYIKGVVVYSTSRSEHYRNIASSIANAKGFIPVTAEVYAQIGKTFSGSNKIDITGWTETTPENIYNKFYSSEYWTACTKRLIISANPADGGDTYHTRDIAAAAKAAVVYLDNTRSSQKTVYQKFLSDMTAGNAIVLGWFTTERSGIIAGTEKGISTIPADLFISGSVYGGTDHKIDIPSVPKRKALANKAYLAIYMSDGDNIQYDQRYMRKLWDTASEVSGRGKVPVNWTIAPGLVDVAPGMMNYYYGKATDYECFVAGPSGQGYFMPINTLRESGASTGDKLTNKTLMDAYTTLTQKYLNRAGIRVVTIWDDASAMQRKSYADNCRYLYGATVQAFGNYRVSSGVSENKLYFIKHEVCYEGNASTLQSNIQEKLSAFKGTAPAFYSYQVSVWGNVKTPDIVSMNNSLKNSYSNKYEIVRADHFFSFYNEANGLPFNLCMLESTKVTGTGGTIKNATDGTPVSLWETSNTGERYLEFDFGKTYSISRYVLRHAEENGMHKNFNTRAWKVQVSTNKTTWTNVDTYQENVAAATDVDITPVNARYMRIVVTDGGDVNTVRLADVEIYGAVK